MRIKDFFPPILGHLKHKFIDKIMIKNNNDCPERCCHFNELYITHDGFIYPCCLVLQRNNMKIAHIRDKEYIKKIYSFKSQCSCSSYKLRKALPSEIPSYEFFTIEFSLKCQAKCAMCGVEAPSWKGKYNFYTKLDELINTYQPKSLVIQGGEVLIQKKVLEWLQEKKDKNPSLFIQLITNCNVDIEMVTTIESIFDLIHISVVGFQPLTYKRIMCLNIKKLKHIINELITRKNIKITLKYLITPINIHEVPLFLKWCIELSPENCLICDSYSKQYINMDSKDNYWNKIINRTADEIKEMLANYKSIIINNNINIEFDSNTKNLFHFDNNFMQAHNIKFHKKY